MADLHSLQLREKCSVDLPAAGFDFFRKAQSSQGPNASGKKQTARSLALRIRRQERLRLESAVAIRTECLLRNSPVEGRDLQGVYLPALGLEGIQFRPEPQLGSTQILGIVADTLFDVVAGKLQWAGVRSAPQSDMNVGMIGIEMRDSNPFQA